MLFESMVMILAKEMPVESVARIVGENGPRIWRVIEHYVEESVKAEDLSNLTRIGIDETSQKKGHNYITLFVDMEESKVINVAEGKDSSTVKSFVKHLEAHEGNADSIEEVSSDMSPAFIKGVSDNLPNAQITFDKFHVMKIVNEAVDRVRRAEQKEQGELKKSRYIWLKNEKNLSKKQRERLDGFDIEKSNLLTVRAYRIKLAFQDIYSQDAGAARESFKIWYFWATHSRLQPMIEAAKTIKRHYEGILRWFESGLTNGVLEGLNSLVQAAKAKARGYRSYRYFRLAVFLVAGKLKYSLPT